MKSCPRSPIVATTLSVLLLSVAGCRATNPRATPQPPDRDAYEALASQLCASAELRVDLSSMRVLMDRVRPRAFSTAIYPRYRAEAVDAELRHGLEYALAERLHLVGPDPFERRAPAADDDALRLAIQHGATHVFAADYVVRGAELDVAARLIEVESRIVVGTARTTLVQEGLGEAAQRALEERPRPHLAEITSAQLAHESHGPGAAPLPVREPFADMTDPLVAQQVEPGAELAEPVYLEVPVERRQGVVTPLPRATVVTAQSEGWMPARPGSVTPSEAWKAARRRAALRAVRRQSQEQ